MMPPPPKPKKEAKLATVRTKEQEQDVYGRKFVGSGRLSEYDVKNKLGEGTFGLVPLVPTSLFLSDGPSLSVRCIGPHTEPLGGMWPSRES